jgi:heme oxygenase
MTHAEPQSTNSSALAALKSATQHEHEALDAALDLMNPEIEAATYRRHLEAFFGFYAPMERALAAVDGWGEQGIDLRARCKTAALRADLFTLGVEEPDVLPDQGVRVLERIKGSESLKEMMMLNAGRSRRASGCTLAEMDDHGISDLATGDQGL